MHHGGWRRYRPSNAFREVARSQPSAVDIFAKVRGRLKLIGSSRRMWRPKDIRYLNQLITSALSQARSLNEQGADQELEAEAWLYALALQAPRAAQAQEEMDRHPHGYANAHERLFELIDFNDTYVSTVLALPEHYHGDFKAETKQLIDEFCDRSSSRRFTDDQYHAIVHGLSREIAVFRGALREGFTAEMTPRSQDAKGIDMVIGDPITGVTINVDVKTRSAYHLRLIQLLHEKRLSQTQVDDAEQNGYCPVINGHNSEATLVHLVRIDHTEMSDVVNFSFVDTSRLRDVLHAMITEQM